jgi:hypothetical protein
VPSFVAVEAGCCGWKLGCVGFDVAAVEVGSWPAVVETSEVPASSEQPRASASAALSIIWREQTATSDEGK